MSVVIVRIACTCTDCDTRYTSCTYTHIPSSDVLFPALPIVDRPFRFVERDRLPSRPESRPTGSTFLHTIQAKMLASTLPATIGGSVTLRRQSTRPNVTAMAGHGRFFVGGAWRTHGVERRANEGNFAIWPRELIRWPAVASSRRATTNAGRHRSKSVPSDRLPARSMRSA